MLEPRLRQQAEIACLIGAARRSGLLNVIRRHGQVHEPEAQACAIRPSDGRRSHLQLEAGHLQADAAVSAKPMPMIRRGSNFAHEPRRHEHRDQCADPARRVTSPSSTPDSS